VIVGVDHIYLTVADFDRSEAFYDLVMRALGFKKGDKQIGGDRHAHYFNPALQVSIRPARSPGEHDSYAPGLHHLCLQAADRDTVDALEKALRELGVAISNAAEYPEYNDDYYAVFFSDPDGLRFEIVARSRHRRRIAERWRELDDGVNPLSRLP